MILLCILGFNIIIVIFNLRKGEYVSPQECFEILKSQFQREYNLISPLERFNKLVDKVNLVISTLKKMVFDSNLRRIGTKLVPPINDYYLVFKSSIKFCWLKVKHTAEIITKSAIKFCWLKIKYAAEIIKKIRRAKPLVDKNTVDYKSKSKFNLIFLLMYLQPFKEANHIKTSSLSTVKYV